MKRSESPYPEHAEMLQMNEYDALKKAWIDGWLDDFSEEHFLIKTIEGRLNDFEGRLQFKANNVSLYPCDNISDNFYTNFSTKLYGLIKFFGENDIKRFVIDQLSAGKNHYVEGQFFRALSEVTILNFWCNRSISGEYEPKTNGKKNPEARFVCRNNVTVDVEVKTGGFDDIVQLESMAIPTVLLDDDGRNEFVQYCCEHDIKPYMPRINKLKDFINCAAEKFEHVDHINHLNLLYINWTFSEFIDSGFEEAVSLLSNDVNGILTHKEIGLRLGLSADVYEKISAVIVYTESLSGLMFNDFTWVWTRNEEGIPHFGIIGMHINDDIIEKTSGMNPYSQCRMPFFIAYLKKGTPKEELFRIVYNHMLTG